MAIVYEHSIEIKFKLTDFQKQDHKVDTQPTNPMWRSENLNLRE